MVYSVKWFPSFSHYEFVVVTASVAVENVLVILGVDFFRFDGEA